MAGLSPINRALARIPKRAEKSENPHLHETFVDSGVADILDVVDHQVLNGRRGTGKTHAFAYLASERRALGDIAIVLDLRTVGSPDGLLDPSAASPQERAGRLLIDLLGQLREAILDAVLEDETLVNDGDFVAKVDHLLTVLTDVRVTGEVETSQQRQSTQKEHSGLKFNAKVSSSPTVDLSAEAGAEDQKVSSRSETRRGTEQVALNFSDIARALRDVAKVLTTRRIWIFLDEWSSVPRDLQPYLGEFLLRCVMPLQKFTVKIAAIEQQSNFMAVVAQERIGLELGADLGATVSLDDYMVYEGNEDVAREFFRGLIFKHLSASDAPEAFGDLTVRNTSDVIRLGFTDTRAFDELVRAAEGVPRDFLHIVSRAATRAGSQPISVDIVREAAKYWYQSDKVEALESREQARALLTWLIDKVIREKRARAFLVREDDMRDPLLVTLFDARVLHVVRRGYSAQDRPGERFDVWTIDYGAYVDLVRTKYAPQGLFQLEDDTYVSGVDVPTQDLRAIRRAILDLDSFRQSIETF
ncbi:hypothetical protein DFJ75_5013 [Williamsia muralis]|uniref:Uncharacterized protein n=1 Tax=Williamsia marianensis TaxID=85044 RepID=A0A495IT69_WILMA|nr:hypothetical protein [Williamsia muralis]RKR79870.1 hypothetical protein DFJ75_5013 [Williamsia muralis]